MNLGGRLDDALLVKNESSKGENRGSRSERLRSWCDQEVKALMRLVWCEVWI